MTEQEEWRPIAGFPGYSISSLGRVLSTKRHHGTDRRYMRHTFHKAGYPQVSLVLPGGGQKIRTIHSLIAEAFIGPRPEGQQVRHLDGDYANSQLSNLAYGTVAENAADALRHGTNPQVRKTHCPSGHGYTPKNTYIDGRGGRRCRTCAYERNRLIADRKALAAANIQTTGDIAA